MPPNYLFTLSHRLGSTAGFSTSQPPQAPLQAAAEAAALQLPLDAGEGGQGPQPPGAQGTGRATWAQDRALPGGHRRRTTPQAGPAGLRGAAPVSPAGTPRRGLRGGRQGGTPRFQQRKGGNGRGGMWTPSPRRGAGSHLQAPESSVPFLPEPFPSRGPIALPSPSRLLCAGVRRSDPPSPRGGNSSRRSATGSTGPFGKGKVTFPASGRAWPPSPHSALPSRGHQRLLLGGRSSPLSPETAATTSEDAHARGRGITWRLEGRRQRGKVGERRPVARTRPSPAHRAGPSSLGRDTPPSPAFRG